MKKVLPNLQFLLVDDAEAIRQLIAGILKDAGVTKIPLQAANITEAKGRLSDAILKDQPVEFIISDWEMPGGTGLDFLQWVRSDFSRFKTIPFIMTTTVNEKDKIIGAIKTGADNYLIKPFEAEQLLSRVVFALKKRNSN